MFSHTCDNGINGGPNAMLAALLPGRILRVEPSSDAGTPRSCSASFPNDSPTEGDCGPIWTSVKGGGLGRRGELDGETPAVMARVERDQEKRRAKTKGEKPKEIKEWKVTPRPQAIRN